MAALSAIAPQLYLEALRCDSTNSIAYAHLGASVTDFTAESQMMISHETILLPDGRILNAPVRS